MAKFAPLEKRDSRRKPSSKPKVPQAGGFWDSPVLMNFVSDVFMLIAAVGLLSAFVLGVQRLPLFPLREVVVLGASDQVTRIQLEYAARRAISGNFFTVNLDSVQAAFEKLPWVRHVDVRRRWPGRLELTVQEHKPVARWYQSDGETRLVNDHGEVFSAASDSNLPLFAGPEGQTAEMLARFKEFSATLAGLDRKLVELHLSPREAWQVKLDDGELIELGREDARHPVLERMKIFASSFSELTTRYQMTAAHVDMRYPNGFALRLNGVGKSS